LFGIDWYMLRDFFAIYEVTHLKRPVERGCLKVFEPDRAEVLARYGAANGWPDGQPAITVSTDVQGRVYLSGAYLSEAAQQTLLQHIIDTAQVAPVLNTPAGVEAGFRAGADGRAVYLLIKHESTAHDVEIPAQMYDYLSRCQINGSLSLAPYGIAVLTQERSRLTKLHSPLNEPLTSPP
jgi:beta-galactosidase